MGLRKGTVVSAAGTSSRDNVSPSLAYQVSRGGLMLALMSGGLFAGVKLAPAISGLSTSITSWQIEGVGGKRKLGTSYGVGKRGRWGG